MPYTWSICFRLKEFEIVTLTNEYNWIDCSSQHPENSESQRLPEYCSPLPQTFVVQYVVNTVGLLCACGELFELSFDLPFDEFLPTTIDFKFWIQVEAGDLNFYVPEVSTTFIGVQSLTKNAKVLNRDGSITWDLFSTQKPDPEKTKKGKSRRWRNICLSRYRRG